MSVGNFFCLFNEEFRIACYNFYRQFLKVIRYKLLDDKVGIIVINSV